MGVVEVVRGDLVEARHSLRVVVADHAGAVVASIGDVEEPTYYRSAAKPLQALPLAEEGVVDRFDLSQAELALCCGSHEGEAEHVAAVRSILHKAGLEESFLRCGAHLPFSAEATRVLLTGGGQAERVHNNCSGKHAGMLALAAALDWDPVDYHLPEHPVQRRMLDEIRRWTELGSEQIRTGIDECGVVCFAVPLRDIAASFARFAAAATPGEAVKRVVSAMTEHSFMVGRHWARVHRCDGAGGRKGLREGWCRRRIRRWRGGAGSRFRDQGGGWRTARGRSSGRASALGARCFLE